MEVINIYKLFICRGFFLKVIYIIFIIDNKQKDSLVLKRENNQNKNFFKDMEMSNKYMKYILRNLLLGKRYIMKQYCVFICLIRIF